MRNINKVKTILKDPYYQKKFIKMLSHEIKYIPKEYQRGVVLELQMMLL